MHVFHLNITPVQYQEVNHCARDADEHKTSQALNALQDMPALSIPSGRLARKTSSQGCPKVVKSLVKSVYNTSIVHRTFVPI